jgi:hypothetical protein
MHPVQAPLHTAGMSRAFGGSTDKQRCLLLQVDVLQEKMQSDDAEETWAAYRSVIAALVTIQGGSTMATGAIQLCDHGSAERATEGGIRPPEGSHQPGIESMSEEQQDPDFDRTEPRKIHKVGYVLDTGRVENLINSSQL